MTLWSDGKTNEEIQKLSEVDGNSVAYNLYEDLLCVKEDLAKANERVKELEKSNKSCAVAIRQLIAKGEIGPLLITGDELDEIVNKFAIETRAKALRSFLDKKCPVSGYVIRDKESREIIAEELELIRKEQE